MKKYLLGILIFTSLTYVFPQGTWAWTGRVHSELDWHQIETEHFNIFYHTGIEEIAKNSASICEQAYPILLKQMDIDQTPTIDVIFTSEDEIMNGYAMWTNQTFIWVDQNDAAIWLEDEKWLSQVLTHELQHIIFFNTIKTWIPEPFGYLFSDVPGWVVEGLAEYYTERWRPYRSDLSHKYHVYQNKTSEMDPHHDGFSKILLLADKFGDSTIVDILHYRNELGMFDFAKAFKKYTHMSENQFNEEWRQVMNTYYYGYRAQKEAIEDIGVTTTLPIQRMNSFLFSPDSLHIAVIGADHKDQQDNSLVIVEIDTTFKEQKQSHFSEWMSRGKSKEESEEKKPHTPDFNKNEIDDGNFHSAMSWSSDGQRLLYSKYRFGAHGSMLYDIRMYDSATEKLTWLTSDRRAAYPIWDKTEENIIFVAHQNGISNLFQVNLSTRDESPLTSYTEDTQILSPQLSPDGNQVAFARSKSDGNCDIAILDLTTLTLKTVTSNPEVDYLPIWHPDGKKITFTSHKGSTPNLHTLDLTTNEIVQNTDVAEAVWGVQWSPNGNTILTKSMNTADSVRVSQIDPSRTITTEPLSIRGSYLNWRTKRPDVPLEGIDPSDPVQISAPQDYRFYHHFKHLTSFVLPLDVLTGATVWTDALGKHIFQLMGGTTWDGKHPFVLAEYVNAQHGPLWGVNYFYNVNWSFRFYDDSSSGLFEKFDGVNFWVSHPINFGNSMASNHTVTAALAVHQRRIVEVTDEDDVPHNFSSIDLTPEEGSEGILTLNYRWINKRPDKRNIALPRQGWGLNLTSKMTSEQLYGDFTYQRYTIDSFTNITAGPGIIFLRVKGELLNGDAPNQDYVGFSDDIAIYGAGNMGTFGLPENMNPRGWDGYLLGDRMIFGTVEYRFPFISSLPVEVFGIKLGQVTFAMISDFGNVWDQSTALSDDWIVTAGYEMKFGIQLGSAPILFIGAGAAQTTDNWQENNRPDAYVRFSMINPF